MVNTDSIRADITIPDNAAETVSFDVAGNKEDDTVACAFPDGFEGVSEVSLDVMAVYAVGPDTTSVSVTFPADGIGKTGNYSVVFAETGEEQEFLQVGSYVRDELAKGCTPSS